ncbi:MAG: chorismate mutase [Burkholderiales bacterium]|nr:chorismate mutase [Burkholderiales bacterium]OJX05242.1 MAG: chorismate mutase [Burkholderiales bacterium 70-64]
MEPDPQGKPLRCFRDPAYRPLAANLAGVRAGIDAIDEQLVALVAERAMLVKDAARFKADAGQVAAPARQAEVIARVRALAARHDRGFEGLEDVVEATWRAMVAAFVAAEGRYFDDMDPIDRESGGLDSNPTDS